MLARMRTYYTPHKPGAPGAQRPGFRRQQAQLETVHTPHHGAGLAGVVAPGVGARGTVALGWIYGVTVYSRELHVD